MQMRSISTVVLIAWLLFSMNAWGDTSTEPTILGPDVQGTKVGPGTDFSGKKLSGSQFVMEDLSGAVFDGADLAGSMFLECDLTGASFTNASLTGVRIGDCNVSRADFTGAAITDIKPAGGLNSPNMYLAPEQLVQTRSFQRKSLKGYAFPRWTLGNQRDLRGLSPTQGLWSRTLRLTRNPRWLNSWSRTLLIRCISHLFDGAGSWTISNRLP